MSGAVEAVEGVRRFRPYPSYKETDVESLNTVPEGWQLKRLRHVVTSIKNGTTARQLESGESDCRVTRIETISSGRVDYERTGFVEHEATLDPYLLEAGDILFSHINSLSMVGNAALYKGEQPLYSGMNLLRFRPTDDVDSRWIWLWLLTSVSRESIRSIAKHAINQVSVPIGSLKNLPVLLPSADEQRSIAEFLDRETGKIDALVAKKERLIELLQEKRKALITHAVTKGLDPTAPTKPSGIHWLGDIPAHWDVKRSRSLFRDVDRRSETGEEELLTVSHLTGVTRRSEKNVTMIEAVSHQGYKICEKGELVINTLWGWMGALGVAWERGIVSPAYNVYRLEETMFSRFVDYYCRTPANVCDITRHSKGVWKSRLRIYPDDFREVLTIVPPLSEQEDIADHLDRELSGMDALQKKIGEGIDRLREFRTALISAAVTGKIDVREGAGVIPSAPLAEASA